MLIIYPWLVLHLIVPQPRVLLRLQRLPYPFPPRLPLLPHAFELLPLLVLVLLERLQLLSSDLTLQPFLLVLLRLHLLPLLLLYLLISLKVLTQKKMMA